MKLLQARSTEGMTILELIIAMLIGSVLISAAFQSHRFIARSASRENDKAQLQRDIFTLIEFLERDIRMAGLGLPGNGLDARLSDTASDHLYIYMNSERRETRLTAQVTSGDLVIHVENGAGMESQKWICFVDNDTVYKKINRVGMNSTGADTVYLMDAAGKEFQVASTRVFPAHRIEYYVNKSAGGFVRKKNDTEVSLSNLLDTMEIVPRMVSGVPGALTMASALTVIFGGRIGSGGDEVFMAESTEVTIRNNL